jgi:hypothetical protein
MSESIIDIADRRFEEVLGIESISINNYRGEQPAVRLFSNATTYPEFFN